MSAVIEYGDDSGLYAVSVYASDDSTLFGVFESFEAAYEFAAECGADRIVDCCSPE